MRHAEQQSEDKIINNDRVTSSLSAPQVQDGDRTQFIEKDND
jgi:hypothetical protein